MKAHAFGLSDVGRRRESNEDEFLVEPALHLYAVADGMGGHAAGEVASRLAVDSLRESLAPRASARPRPTCWRPYGRPTSDLRLHPDPPIGEGWAPR
jgi:serine/threonine protein phosphatase PrpC